MIVKLLETNDNIQDYIDCTKELNNPDVQVSTIDQIKEALTIRSSNILTFVLVDDNNRIVASATTIMEKKLRYQRLCCYIEDVGVHPDHRGKGYGKDIVSFCVEFAKKNRCYKVKLNCNEDLVKFYENKGFKIHGYHMYL